MIASNGAAAIGSGRVDDSPNGTQSITIIDGTVTAQGGQNGSGIGSGYDAHTFNHKNYCGTITISGGTVKATPGTGANATAIGGYFASDDEISISGGAITATINTGGQTAIGGANNSNSHATIDISDGKIVTSTGNITNPDSINNSVGIGDGHNYNGATKGNINLDFTDTSSVKSFNYKGTVSLENGATISESNTTLAAGQVTNLSQIANVTLVKKIVPKYSITFVNYDGTELQSSDVAYGETPVYNGETPTKTDPTGQYSYTFSGWDPEISAVTGEATYTAQFTSTVNEYTIKFVNGDDVLQSSDVAYGETPAYNGETPSKTDPTGQYSYTFSGWDPEISAVTGEATYTAQFTSTLNEYTITFVNYNDEVLQSSLVAYGETPAYEGETPAKDPDSEHIYTFAGWDTEIVAVTGNATYTATYTSEDRAYVVTWIVNGLVTTSTVFYGQSPEYEGETPTKESVNDIIYRFAGWQTTGGQITYAPGVSLPNVITDGVSYTAVFTPVYNISLNIIDGAMTTNAEDNMAAYGAQVWLTLTPEDGYNYHEGSIKVLCGDEDVPVYQYNDSQFYFDMPAGDVEVYAACECFYNIWVNGEQISSLTASDVLHDADNGIEPRITYSEDGASMVLTIHTAEDITIDNLQSGSMICVDDEEGRPFTIVAPYGFSLVSDSANYGILSTRSEIDILGDVNLTGNSESFSGIGSFNDVTIDIRGCVSITATNATDGFGLFTSGTIYIEDEVSIVGGGATAISATGPVEIGASVSIDGSYLYGIYSGSNVSIGGDATISVKNAAINAAGTIRIDGDLSVTTTASQTGENAINADDTCDISGDLTLNVGGTGNGLLAYGINIGGNVAGSMPAIEDEDASWVFLYSFGDITIIGSLDADNPNGSLLCAYENDESSGSIQVRGDISGTSYDGIHANGDLDVYGDVDMETTSAEEYAYAIEANSIMISGDLSLTCVGNGISAFKCINLQGDVSIESTGEDFDAVGILAFDGDITMTDGVWDISVVNGTAISSVYQGIIIPSTHGISIPEDGCIKYYDDMIGTTVLLGDDVQSSVRIESFVTVTFVNEDGTELQSVESYPGQSPKYTEENPTKESSEDKDFTFWGWQDEEGNKYETESDLPVIEDGSADLIYSAVYTESARKYTIKFVNGDDVLQSSDVAYGETPVYNGETPSKTDPTGQYSYTFSGWDPEISAVTGEATYTAQFDETVNQYEVTFYDEDGKTVLLEAAPYNYGTKPGDIKTPEKTPTKKDDEKYTYEFEGWDPELSEVTGDANYTAKYKAVLKEFTIKFVNEDGTELQSTKVAYGTKPTYTGTTPTKAADDKYTYEFESWTPAIADVTADATYTAKYKATEIKKDPVKGVYKYIGEAAKYTKGSKKAVTIIFKRTENDEITFDMFAGVKTAKGNLVSGTHYTAKKGSVEITLLPEYLETLEVGKTAITVSFQDGDPVTIELEVVAAQQQADTNPTTGDTMNMNYIWIICVIGAAALAIVLFVQIRRRREEEF